MKGLGGHTWAACLDVQLSRDPSSVRLSAEEVPGWWVEDGGGARPQLSWAIGGGFTPRMEGLLGEAKACVLRIGVWEIDVGGVEAADLGLRLGRCLAGWELQTAETYLYLKLVVARSEARRPEPRHSPPAAALSESHDGIWFWRTVHAQVGFHDTKDPVPASAFSSARLSRHLPSLPPRAAETSSSL